MAAQAHTLRLIGGQWRSRRIAIEAAADLRPTPDRIRETLFNWLAPRIAGARCLDLFAGTGALGLEALSRGAAHVTFVDNKAANVQALQRALVALECDDADVLQADALACANHLQTSYDVVFVDPPFAAALHRQALAAIKPIIQPYARIYLEYPATQAETLVEDLPSDWQLLRKKQAGRVGYCLVCQN